MECPPQRSPAVIDAAIAVSEWRRVRDSNPRTCYSQRFSRPPHSTALPTLRDTGCSVLNYSQDKGFLPLGCGVAVSVINRTSKVIPEKPPYKSTNFRKVSDVGNPGNFGKKSGFAHPRFRSVSEWLGLICLQCGLYRERLPSPSEN